MADLNDEEKLVLRALNELEPATLDELAIHTRLPAKKVQNILDSLIQKGLLTSLGDGQKEKGDAYKM